MDSDNSPPFLVPVLRIAAFICGLVAVLLVLGAFGSAREIATANFVHAFMCVGSGIGLLWMAKVLELLHEIATKKSPPPDAPVPAPAPAPAPITEG
jgi:hypothetical protein